MINLHDFWTENYVDYPPSKWLVKIDDGWQLATKTKEDYKFKWISEFDGLGIS